MDIFLHPPSTSSFSFPFPFLFRLILIFTSFPSSSSIFLLYITSLSSSFLCCFLSSFHLHPELSICVNLYENNINFHKIFPSFSFPLSLLFALNLCYVDTHKRLCKRKKLVFTGRDTKFTILRRRLYTYGPCSVTKCDRPVRRCDKNTLVKASCDESCTSSIHGNV